MVVILQKAKTGLPNEMAKKHLGILICKKLTRVIYLLVIYWGINSSCLYAQKYYVDAVNGLDTNNGLTALTAKKTLGWLTYKTNLNPGDTVFIMNGTYTSTSGFAIIALRSSGSAAAPLVITNYPGHSPLLQMGAQWHAIHLGEGIHHIVINGLRIKGNASTLNLDEALQQPGSCANPTGPTLAKFNGNGITIDGRTNSALVHHVTVRNCEIFECSGGGCSSLQGDYLTYENNLIYNNCWYMVYGGSGISNLNTQNYDDHSAPGYTNIIRNNILYGNELYVPWIGPCKIYDGNGIIIDSENNATIGKPAYTGRTLIENNVVYYNGGRGIHMFKSSNVDVINNTCFQNGRSPALSDGEITVQDATNVRVYNNIMYARTGENANYKNAASTGFSSGYNLIYNASGNKIYFTEGSDVTGQDPQFINTEITSGNFRIAGTSPAIDKGTDMSGLFSLKDVTGVARPLNSKPDIGAYEIAKNPSTTITESRIPGLYVFPSPTTGIIMFSNTEKKQVVLFSLTGSKLATFQNVGNSIDISKYPSGIYLLQITMGDKKCEVKVVKQ